MKTKDLVIYEIRIYGLQDFVIIPLKGSINKNFNQCHFWTKIRNKLHDPISFHDTISCFRSKGPHIV